MRFFFIYITFLKRIMYKQICLAICSLCLEVECFVPKLSTGVMAPCDNVLVYRNITDTTISVCMEECLRRSRCSTIVYSRTLKVCGLIESSIHTLTYTGNTRATCLYMDMLTDPEVHGIDIGACASRPCNVTDRCRNSTSGLGYDCVASECLHPEPLLNGYTVSSMQIVGCLNFYKCKKGFNMLNYSSITCLENATWSTTNSRCAGACPTPLSTFTSAIIVSTHLDTFHNGDVLTLEARNGYHHNNVSGASVSFLCNETDTWDSEIVPFCVDGFSLTPHGKNYMCASPLFSTGENDTIDMIEDHCVSLGGKLGNWGRAKSAAEARGSPRTLLLNDGRKSNQYNKYVECLQNITGSQNSTDGLTIVDDLIQAIRTENVTESYPCKNNIDRWNENEPSGGTSENCIGAAFSVTENKWELADVGCDPIPTGLHYVCWSRPESIF